MKRILMLTGVAVFFFAASFGVSYFVGKNARKSEALSPQTQPAGAEAPEAVENATLASLAPKEKELDDLIREVRQKTADCRLREQQLLEREKRIQIAQDLLKKEAQDLETLRQQLVVPLTKAKEAQAELQRTRVLISLQEKANLKKTAAIYEKMDAANGSKILEGMCSGTQEDDAVKLLHYMSERAAAKLLGEISDKTLAARLCEKLKKVREES